jgi:hypothetical protein
VCYRSKFSSWRINYSKLGIGLEKCGSTLTPKIRIEGLKCDIFYIRNGGFIFFAWNGIVYQKYSSGFFL